MAFSKSFKLILPSLCGCTLTTSNPLSSRRSIHFSTLGCSKAVVTIFLPSRFFAPTAPNIAVLFDTVPQGVKYISSGLAFKLAAIVPRLFSRSIYVSTPF